MKGIKRFVYSRATLLPSVIIADAGSDQTVGDLASIVLDGTGSSTTDGGGITSWLWEIIEGEPYGLTTPTQSTCSVTGFPTNGTIIVRLTVGDATGNIASTTISILVDIVTSTLSISSDIPDLGGQGTITISGGEASEVINLAFTLQSTTSGDIVYVTDDIAQSIPVGELNWMNTLRYGQVTLDGNGDFTMYYEGIGSNFSMNVNMIQRSIGATIPAPSSTTVQFQSGLS